MSEVAAIEKRNTAARNFLEITKARLSVSVVFSSVAGYLIGADSIDWTVLLMLCLGGYGLVGASNTFNQLIERDLDAKMQRTKMRPLPSGQLSTGLALSIGFTLAIVGTMLLAMINTATAFFGVLSIVLYVALYTPLKTKTPLCVFVGAFPGAIPFMLGWVAASGSFGIEPGTLFMIQFFWQFPHFWAIGWMLENDYKLGGFKMLPTGTADRGTALQIVLYTIWTVAASLIPAMGVTGSFYITPISAIVVLLMGLIFLYFAIRLFRERTNSLARKLMLASVSYITLLQIIYVADKFLR